jgi:hypothetical protein
VRIWGLSKTQANYRPAPRREVRPLRIHVSPARRGRVQIGPRTDPRQRNLRSLRSSPRPPRRLVSLVVRPKARPGHTATSKKRGRGYGSPRDCRQPQPEPRLRLPRWQQGTPCHDASASSLLDDFLRQTSVPAGRGTRTLRRYRNDLGLEVRNDRYSVLRSRGGVRGEGADAQLRRRRSSLPSQEPGCSAVRRSPPRALPYS